MSTCLICPAAATTGQKLRLRSELKNLLLEKYHKDVITTDICTDCRTGLRLLDYKHRHNKTLNILVQDLENWIAKRETGPVKRVKKENNDSNVNVEIRKSSRPRKPRENLQFDAKKRCVTKKIHIVGYKKMFPCEQKDCHEIFEDCNEYITHNIEVHGISHRCKDCNANFETEISLKHHIRKVHTFKCIACMKTVKTEGLDLHKIVPLQGEVKQCGLCCKSFDSYCVLLKHLTGRHSNLISLYGICCPYCPDYAANRRTKRFRRSIKTDTFMTNFMTHLTRKHGDVIKGEDILAKCDECGKYFGSKQVLEDHKAKGHNFHCFICKMCFSDEHILTEHLHICRKESNTCEICNKSFPEKADLETHKRSHKKEFGQKNICIEDVKKESDLYSTVEIKEEIVDPDSHVLSTIEIPKEEIAVQVKEEMEVDPLAISGQELDFGSLVKTESLEDDHLII